MKFLREKHKTCLRPCVLMTQRWGCHPPAHSHHPTDWVLPPPPGGQYWLPPALQGQRNAGNRVSYLSGELIPTARELFTEVVPAGQTRPLTLPVCVLAQIFIHFLRKTMKCNKPWEGWDLWKQYARSIFRNRFSLSFFSPQADMRLWKYLKSQKQNLLWFGKSFSAPERFLTWNVERKILVGD